MPRLAAAILSALLVICTAYVTEAAKIVLFAPSHAANVRTYTNVGRALSAMGHTAYVAIPDFMVVTKSVNEDGIVPLHYGKKLGNVDDHVSKLEGANFFNNISMGAAEAIEFLALAERSVEIILSDKKFMAQLKNINADLFVFGHVVMVKNLVTIAYMLDKPFAVVGAINDYISQRTPISLSASPTQVYGGFRQKGMNFQERFLNAMTNLLMLGINVYVTSEDLVARHAPHRPTISTDLIMTQAEVYVVECDPVMDHARPMMPNVKFVGSTAGKDALPLKEPYKTFMDKSTKGVIVVTFGSYFMNFPDYVSSKMIAAFMRLPQTVVWRANMTSPAPHKILTTKWLPQNDLLAHRNTRLFVSHCGANGQYEGLYHAVPMLCLPVFGDQPYNADRNVVKGFGLHEDIRTLTADEFYNVLREMLDNDKYRKNIKKASGIYREMFPAPINATAYWLDHVIKHGGEYMRSAGHNMPLWQFLDVDVWAVLVLGAAVVGVVLGLVCRCCCRLCCKRSSKEKTE